MGDLFFNVLETDLRLVSSEARKGDSLAQHITGWLNHSEVPQIKEGAERAVLKLRLLHKEGRGVESLREATDVLRPFLIACEMKSARLASVSLSTFQKLLANNAISSEGRRLIIDALLNVEKFSDEHVKLRLLQTSLTLLQMSEFADDEDGIGKLLGLCFRVYTGNKNSPTVTSTAAATIRQAVSLVFDHSILPSTSTSTILPSRTNRHYGDMLGQEAVALNILTDFVAMCSGSPPTWLRTPIASRTFILDLLESVLLYHSEPFHRLPQLTVALRKSVCHVLEGLLRSAVDPDVDAESMGDCRLVVRCVSALLRRHHSLAPDKCGSMMTTLMKGLHSKCAAWQRIMILQVLRQISADPVLIYRLFELYDLRMDFELNAVSDMIHNLHEVIRASVRDNAEDDFINTLSSLHDQLAAGKDVSLDVDTLGPVIPWADTMLAFLAMESALSFVSSLEKLAQRAVSGSEVEAADGMSQLEGSNLQGETEERRYAKFTTEPSADLNLTIEQDVVSNMVNGVWRNVLSMLQTVLLLTKSQEPLLSALLHGYSSFAQAADALGAIGTRDAVIVNLCDFTLTNPEDPAMLQVLSGLGLAKPTASSENSSLLWLGRAAIVSPSSPLTLKILNTKVTLDREGLTFSPRNTAAIRTLFGLTHRLANNLGSAWIYVVDVLHCLDRILLDPHTTMLAASEAGPGTVMSDGSDKDPPGESNLRRGSKPIGGGVHELSVLSAAANQIFANTSNMSTDAVGAVLAALGEVSGFVLPSQAATVAVPRLHGLTRMVDVLLVNLTRITLLWGIFLQHVLLVIRSTNAQVRSAALEALNRTITGALGPDPSTPHHRPSASDGSGVDLRVEESQGRSYVDSEGVENMLLVALDSLYREDGELDVRKGLLRIVVHVLQRHGDNLTRGWVPLLRLLEAVPAWRDVGTITLAFQAVELLTSDFLPNLPKEYIQKALDVVALFAEQDVFMNTALSAVTMLWSTMDFLARSRGRSPSNTAVSAGGAAVSGVATTSAGGDAASSQGQAVLSGGRHDLDEEECLALMMSVFRHFCVLARDARPEVRNAAVRTLFLAVGSHGAKFNLAHWELVLWELLFPLVHYIHHQSVTSSSTEAEGPELGRERSGRTVNMMVHHSRNTQQKQWDETLVMALGGVCKVLRQYLAVVVVLPGFPEAWRSLMDIAAAMLRSGRKNVVAAALNLVSGVLTAHASSGVAAPWMWRGALTTFDAGVAIMTVPNTSAPLAARTELLNGIASLYNLLREQMSASDIRMLLRWLDRFARYPIGCDDPTALHSGLGPIHKIVLNILGSLVPVQVSETWPDIIAMLCGTLCPFKLLPYQRAAAAAAASRPPSTSVPAAKASDGARAPGHVRSSSVHSLPRPEDGDLTDSCALQADEPVTDLSVEARSLTPMWMTRISEMVAGYYKDGVPWGMKAKLFPLLISALAECMALRHIDPNGEVWKSAATAFNTVVAAGLPAVNSECQRALSENKRWTSDGGFDAWSELAKAFEMFFLAQGVPAELLSGVGAGQSVTPAREPVSRTSSLRMSVGGVEADASMIESEAVATVLDTLADHVLSSCTFMPVDIRRRMIGVLDAGAAGTSSPAEPGPGSSARFSHMCLRKLYVLVSRGSDVGWSSGSGGNARLLLEVAQIALPVLLHRCGKLLRRYAAESLRETGANSSRSDEALCVLEILSSLSPAPSVVEALGGGRRSIVAGAQDRAGPSPRTHLAVMYEPLVACISSSNIRVRSMVGEMLAEVGRDLGLSGWDSEVVVQEAPKS